MNKFITAIIIFGVPIPLIIVSLLVGPSDVASPWAILSWMGHQLPFLPHSQEPHDALIRTILFDVRLPRILLTFLVGGCLTISGGSLQAVFRNPLVDPYILGISSGAAFGAAAAMAIGIVPVQLAAFVCGISASALSVVLARKNRVVSVVALILAGIVVNGIFTALLTVVQFISDPFRLQTIVHWTMGNLHNATWDKLRSGVIPMVCGATGLIILSWRHNLLALGDDETRSAGLHPFRQKLLMVLFATLAASGAVSVAGIIGFVGLVLPHMVRIMTGPDNRVMLPSSFFSAVRFSCL